jgi:hypothetical protein
LNVISNKIDNFNLLLVQVLLRDIVVLENSGPWIVGGRIDLKKVAISSFSVSVH